MVPMEPLFPGFIAALGQGSIYTGIAAWGEKGYSPPGANPDSSSPWL